MIDDVAIFYLKKMFKSKDKNIYWNLKTHLSVHESMKIDDYRFKYISNKKKRKKERIWVFFLYA